VAGIQVMQAVRLLTQPEALAGTFFFFFLFLSSFSVTGAMCVISAVLCPCVYPYPYSLPGTAKIA
jgi:hypothetical protein